MILEFLASLSSRIFAVLTVRIFTDLTSTLLADLTIHNFCIFYFQNICRFYHMIFAGFIFRIFVDWTINTFWIYVLYQIEENSEYLQNFLHLSNNHKLWILEICLPPTTSPKFFRKMLWFYKYILSPEMTIFWSRFRKKNHPILRRRAFLTCYPECPGINKKLQNLVKFLMTNAKKWRT